MKDTKSRDDHNDCRPPNEQRSTWRGSGRKVREEQLQGVPPRSTDWEQKE